MLPPEVEKIILYVTLALAQITMIMVIYMICRTIWVSRKIKKVAEEKNVDLKFKFSDMF